MENENLNTVQKLTPFTKMIMTIGTLPSSFYASMSYYESMVWLYEYLKNTVIPTVNNNADAVEELQAKFIELKTYIDEYFDDLDVQEEINHKLDVMASDGSLTTLIKNYIDPLYQAYEEEINQNLTTYQTNLTENMNNFQSSVNTSISSLTSKVNTSTEGTPKGVYATVAALTSANPNHDYIYVVTETGNWYYYDSGTSSWTSGGTYLASVTTADSINFVELNGNAIQKLDYDKSAVAYGYTKFMHPLVAWENGALNNSTGETISSNNCLRMVDTMLYSSSNPILVHLTSAYRYKVFDYGTNGTFVGNSGWISDLDTKISDSYNNHYIKIEFNETAAATETLLPIYTLFSYCKMVYANDKIEGLKQLKEYTDKTKKGQQLDYKVTPMRFGYNSFLSALHDFNKVEAGGITYTNGNNQDSIDACRTIEKTALTGDFTIINTDPSKYRVRIFKYNTNGSYNSYEGWYSDKVIHVKNDTTKLYRIGINTVVSQAALDITDALEKVAIVYDSNKLNHDFKSAISSGAHQGGIFDGIPQNTLEAFNNSYHYGFDSVELDVLWTSDRVPVISHDDTRTTVNSQSITISETSYEDLITYQFYQDSSIKIPKLEDVLQICKVYGYTVNLEFKTYEFSDSELQAIIKLIDKLNMKDKVIYNCVHTSVLLRCRTYSPSCRLTLGLAEAPSVEDLTTSGSYSELRTLLGQEGETILSLQTTAFGSVSISRLGDYQDLGYKTLIYYSGSNTSDIVPYVPYINYLLTNYFTMNDVVYENDILDMFD